MREIDLTNTDKKALIDDSDFERVNQFRWLLLKNGYVMSNSAEHLYLHRFIFGVKIKARVDHKDRNPLNNRRHNLRSATNSQNQANAAKQQSYNNHAVTSKFKGVSWYPRHAKWRTTVAGKHVGYFNEELEAAAAYNEIALEKFGEFALLNVF
jgi:hypothetical protein